MMKLLALTTVLALACLVQPTSASANTVSIALDLSDGNAKQHCEAHTEAIKDSVPVARAFMETQAGVKLKVQWKVSSTGKEISKDALIHFYVVKIDKPGQAPPPLEPKDVLIETAQILDFSEGTQTSAMLQFLPAHPGIYLVRIETESGAEGKIHEHTAAIDLIVK